MAQKEIPRGQWKAFCKKFSKEHQGWLVTLTDVAPPSKAKQNGNGRANGNGASGHPAATAHPAPEASARIVAEDLALQQIFAERDGKNIGLRIVAGEGADRVTHLVLDPAQIRLEKTRYGTNRGLRICSADNDATLVRFHVPQLS